MYFTQMEKKRLNTSDQLISDQQTISERGHMNRFSFNVRNTECHLLFNNTAIKYFEQKLSVLLWFGYKR